MHVEDAAVPPGTTFVAHEEVKHTVGSRKVVKIYLVDKEGKKHLAAVGEDLGDAHYHYRSTKPFGSKYGYVDCTNRKDLTQWMEAIIAESGSKEGKHLGVNEQDPEGVYFTEHRYERAHMSDGRRVNRWFLVDQHGNVHLAVIGIERDTRDGHYIYNAEEPFAAQMPLQCSNQSGVFKWLEKWITHHAAGHPMGNGQATASGTASGGAAASAGASIQDATSRNPPLFISLSAIREARRSEAALLAAGATAMDPTLKLLKKEKEKKLAPTPSAAAAGSQDTTSYEPMPKQRPVGVVQQNQIKKARKLQEDARAEHERLVGGHITRLRRAAAAELQADNAAKQVTMSWLQGGVTRDELDALEHWVGLLQTVLDLQLQQQQPDGQTAAAASTQLPAASQQQEPQQMQLEQPQGQQQTAQQPTQQQQQEQPIQQGQQLSAQEQQLSEQQPTQQQQSAQEPTQQQQQEQPIQQGQQLSAQEQQLSEQQPTQQQQSVQEPTQQQQQGVQQPPPPQQPQEPSQQMPPPQPSQQPPQQPQQTQLQQQQQEPPQQQQPPLQPQQQQQQEAKKAQAVPSSVCGMSDKELLAWLRQPGTERHHLRIMLECLKEIASVDLPARVLLGHKVVGLVRRCLSSQLHEAVRSLAQDTLQRWTWQMTGHMQVLTNPAYMEDHLAVINADLAAGEVPLPQLPKHKQVLMSTPLPTLHGPSHARVALAPQPHNSQQQEPASPEDSTQSYQPEWQPSSGLSKRSAAAGANSLRRKAHAAGYLQAPGQAAGRGSPGNGLLPPAGFSNSSFSTPASALSGLYRSGSPALAAALGMQHALMQGAAGGSMLQPSALGPGQQMTIFGCPDPTAAAAAAGLNYGMNGTAGLLKFASSTAGLRALSAAQQYAAVSSAMAPSLQQQAAVSSAMLPSLQQQLQLQQSQQLLGLQGQQLLGLQGQQLLGLQQQGQQLLQLQQNQLLGLQQQLYLQQQADMSNLAAAAAAGGTQLSQALLQQPLALGQLPPNLLAQQQQQLQQQQLQQLQQQQQLQWLSYLQQPLVEQPSLQAQQQQQQQQLLVQQQVQQQVQPQQ